jgi:hypothetical protein
MQKPLPSPKPQRPDSQINPVHQPPPTLLLSPPPTSPLPLITALPTRIHRIIFALCEPILRAPIVRQHRAEDGALEVRRDAPDHHTVRAGRLVAREGAGFEDRELQVRFLGVREGEVLVICKSGRYRGLVFVISRGVCIFICCLEWGCEGYL